VAQTAEMMKSKNIGSILVIESMKTKRLIGIVTDRDLTLQVVANGHESKTTKIADVMTRKLITCTVDDDIQKAVKAMAEHQLHRIPVVDKDHKIAGIISLADVATRVGQRKKLAKVVKKISQPTV
jgi:CBS domain-containing protein